MKYVPRLSCPDKTDKYYVSGSYNPFAYNYNIFKMNGNCTTYCFGRWAELLNKKPNLCVNQAELWYTHKDEYKRGQIPRLGAIACYSKGSPTTASDGAGHVCIVEEIYSDGSILVSESGAHSFIFRTRKLNNKYEWGSSYKFQGFIYLPIEYDNEPTKKSTYSGEYPTLPSRGYFCYDTKHKKVLDRGEQVKSLQRLLNWILDVNLSIDGLLGPACDKAILEYQKKYGLTQDGCFGKACLAKAKTIEK